jgi:hypothetical protein
MTSTVHQQDRNRYSGINGLILLFLAAVLLVGLALSVNIDFPLVAKIKPIPQIQYQPHSVERHGAEALEIRKCLNDKGGADEIWRSFDKNTFYLWCQLSDGRWSFMAIIQDAFDRLWYESTSFVKGDGTREALIKYMEKFGTKFNGPYPWQ